jgi:hypothetical protein
LDKLSALEYPAVDLSQVLLVRAAADEASAALGGPHIIRWKQWKLFVRPGKNFHPPMDSRVQEPFDSARQDAVRSTTNRCDVTTADRCRTAC